MQGFRLPYPHITKMRMFALVLAGLLVALLGIGNSAVAELEYGIRWTDQFGSTGNDLIYAATTDSAGNLVVAGWTTGSLEGTNAGMDDAFVRWYAPNGTVLRTDQLGTRVTLIENFASQKTVKEKLNDRRIAEPPMDENSKKIRELTEAMHAERDIRIRNRMMAVLGVLKGRSAKIASDFADVDQRTVQLWVARFDEGGIDGLRDAPGRGRASRARYGRIRKLADRLAGKNMLTPRKLRNWIRWRLDARYGLCSVRRILRFLGFSSKRSATMYASAADADSVRQWQAGATGTISGAKRHGFTILVQGESIFLRTETNGRKLWSRVGDPVTVSRHGRRDKTIVYDTLAEDGTRLMRQYGRFDGPTFVRYLKEMRRKWGKVLLVTDNASQHKHREVRKYLEEHDGLEILYLPTATPKLSAVESVWKDANYRFVTSEHYETLEDLTHAVSEYFRTCSIRLDIYKFLYRCV